MELGGRARRVFWISLSTASFCIATWACMLSAFCCSREVSKVSRPKHQRQLAQHQPQAAKCTCKFATEKQARLGKYLVAVGA